MPRVSERIQGLLHLLDEPDESALPHLLDQLSDLPAADLDAALVATDDEESRVRDALHQLVLRRATNEWLQATGESIDLERACLAIAMLHMWNEPYSVRSVPKMLDAMSEELRIEIQGMKATPIRVIAALRLVLSQRRRLGGANEDYYSPNNSLLPHVIESGNGIPISLCAIAILIGRRLGLPVYGINTPGHFLGMVGDPLSDEVRYFDPYTGYLPLSPDSARKLVEELPPDVVLPASDRSILTRMLRNLVVLHDAANRDDLRDTLIAWGNRLQHKLQDEETS